MIVGMTDVTRILNEIEQGDPSASEKLLPLVYEELRVLARQRLAHEKPGQTLQATALVHEAYLRLVGNDNDQSWDNRGHFFAAAAEAMRRILVENARRKNSVKHGGEHQRIELTKHDEPAFGPPADEVLAVHEALEKLAEEDPLKARVVMIRYFTGCSIDETAQILNISPATVKRYWSFSRAFLFAEIADTQAEK